MRRCLSLLVLLLSSLSGVFSWETAIAGVLTTPPAQGTDRRIYSTADDRALHCLDSLTGHEYWSYRPGGKLKGFTVVSPDSSILILSLDNTLLSVSPGGRELWRFPLMSSPPIPPAIDSYGTIYLMKDHGTLICLDRTGLEVWSRSIDGPVSEIFALQDRVLLVGPGKTQVYFTDGEQADSLDEAPAHIVYKTPNLYWQKQDGSWKQLDLETLQMKDSESPLAEGILYPENQILISYENKIISGRKDWFMEALEAGEEAYDPYYQSGTNPGRTRSLGVLPGQSQRYLLFKNRSGAPLLPLLMIDQQFLSQILKEYEEIDSFQELIRKESDYDLVFQEILSDSHVLNMNVNRERLDEYSRYRIYKILSRWGNLKSRETLLFLSKTEQNPQHLALILDGLGRIGLDGDGRSMLSVVQAAEAHPGNPDLLLAAVRSSSRLAKYNGGRAILTMMKFYNTLQQRNLPASVQKQISFELKSF
ncbi:hypothetical protein EXM22_04570 [Oceanispirochaeta crateris]|uniref:Pyrrolo-quinoline quinone repeat domain-containing protein n=1 Tax=Oceanispirochaeta crateris TaxID=2518645 RepID=A0A5C1QIK3_9SPIO|nr:PQQ-binding-like beta-propeller repeat protein [Oceanispirochaeta crateris]QEN07297.1 hypothetical protein EXM22_04570 [Oceanispirochaeta crateris]